MVQNIKNAVKILNKSHPEVVKAFSKELLSGNLLSILRKNKNEKLVTKKVNANKVSKSNLSLKVLDQN